MLELLHAIIRPLAKLIGKLHAPYSTCKIVNEDLQEILASVKPYDVILTRSSGEMTNLFIPGFWKHAAMFIDEGRSVIEATGIGVHYTPIFDLLKRIDYFVVIRFASEKEAKAFDASVYIGKPYDYDFERNPKAYYCSELVVALIEQGFDTTIKFEDIVYPNDLAENMAFTFVCDSQSWEQKYGKA